MIYHRKWAPKAQDDEVIKQQVETSEICGFPKRNTHASDLPCVKAYTGHLPVDANGGIEFETDLPPLIGGHPNKPEWYADPPLVRICSDKPDCVCMTVKITKYKMLNEPMVIL